MIFISIWIDTWLGFKTCVCFFISRGLGGGISFRYTNLDLSILSNYWALKKLKIWAQKVEIVIENIHVELRSSYQLHDLMSPSSSEHLSLQSAPTYYSSVFQACKFLESWSSIIVCVNNHWILCGSAKIQEMNK